MSHQLVFLQKCQSYNIETLKSFFDRCFGDVLSASLHSSRVLIKPNLISAKKYGPATTDPRFMLALAEYFIDRGAVVSLGDSPAFGSAAGVLRGVGAEKELMQRGVAIKEFSQVTNKKLSCGLRVGVASEVFEHDYFINAPKVKSHGQLYVTIAVKNIFGIVKGMRKSMLHMQFGGKAADFSRIILDLIDLLPPHFSCLDGIVAMHKGGPIHGEPLNLGCLGFAQDPVALDTAILNALQLHPENSPLWREAMKRGYDSADRAKLEFPVLSPEAFHGVRFHPPEQLSPIRFNPFRFLLSSMKRLGLNITGK